MFFDPHPFRTEEIQLSRVLQRLGEDYLSHMHHGNFADRVKLLVQSFGKRTVASFPTETMECLIAIQNEALKVRRQSVLLFFTAVKSRLSKELKQQRMQGLRRRRSTTNALQTTKSASTTTPIPHAYCHRCGKGPFTEKCIRCDDCFMKLIRTTVLDKDSDGPAIEEKRRMLRERKLQLYKDVTALLHDHYLYFVRPQHISQHNHPNKTLSSPQDGGTNTSKNISLTSGNALMGLLRPVPGVTTPTAVDPSSGTHKRQLQMIHNTKTTTTPSSFRGHDHIVSYASPPPQPALLPSSFVSPKGGLFVRHSSPGAPGGSSSPPTMKKTGASESFPLPSVIGSQSSIPLLQERGKSKEKREYKKTTEKKVVVTAGISEVVSKPVESPNV
eukprot:PhF_6_TR21076/c0_g1_i2/m.30374